MYSFFEYCSSNKKLWNQLLCNISTLLQCEWEVIFNLKSAHSFFFFLSFSVLCPDAFLFPHVWRRHRDPQRVQEKRRTSSSPPEPDGRSGQLLADEGGPAQPHPGLSGHVWGQSRPKFKGWHLPGWHHFLFRVSACLPSWSRGQHSSASCRYTLCCLPCFIYAKLTHENTHSYPTTPRLKTMRRTANLFGIIIRSYIHHIISKFDLL